MPHRSGPSRRALAARSRRIADSAAFTTTVFCLIVGNAALMGVETYDGVVQDWHDGLKLAEHLFLAAFTLEILVRAAAHADRPRDFFRDPWNLFDLAVVALALAPFARENATVLRLLRLARVLRAARFLPQVRIVIVAIGKSLPGTLSFLLVGALLLYVYSMVGWVFLADDDPEHFGSLGRAALTLSLLITLDGLGDAVRAGLEVSRWTVLYFASYVLLGSFVLVNLLIGVVINSLEEARQVEAQSAETATTAAAADGQPADVEEMRRRISEARAALDALERGFSATTGTAGSMSGDVRAAAVPAGRA
ncbi:ion transporter [Streptomyces sp. BR123]|uniref:ion transporter n=1 Tax=Streptomyces sp. BR123 TaxID=2749828 RepID=UPI0015C46C5A|nr:ion transporter [Streptomyces sp. BR123]NXY96564.1 ion transporter [Streptomyces sp. BR123]